MFVLELCPRVEVVGPGGMEMSFSSTSRSWLSVVGPYDGVGSSSRQLQLRGGRGVDTLGNSLHKASPALQEAVPVEPLVSSSQRTTFGGV